MSRNQVVRRLLAMITIITMFVLCIVEGVPAQSIKAAESTEDLANQYFNTTIKYLYLGEKGKTEFDFDIKPEALVKGATYSWYIGADKGKSNAVTINKETGVVKAKRAGTAYIRCRIKNPDGTVIKPEATVIVLNAVTEIELRNVPDNNTVAVGKEIDFNYKILNTAAGKGKASEAVILFEIADDTAWADNITKEGKVIPLKEGTFRIRVVSFQDQVISDRWLNDKVANASYITAASEWQTIKVVSGDGSAIATNQRQLEELLKLDSVKQINIKTSNELAITIPKGNYPNKTLVVSAPNCSIINNGVFKQIIIDDMKTKLWDEYATGNSITVNDPEMSIYIESVAKVTQLTMAAHTLTANIIVDGVIETLTFNAPRTDVMAYSGNIVVKPGDGVVNHKIQLQISAINTPPIINFDAGSTDSTFTTQGQGSSFSYMYNKTSSIIIVRVGGLSYNLTPGSVYLKDQLPDPNYVASYKADNLMVFTPVTSSLLYAGQKLSDCVLNGVFIDSRSNKIWGTFSWNTPSAIVSRTGVYAWTFKPYDSVNYNIITGVVVVNAVVMQVPLQHVPVSATAIRSGDRLYNSTLTGIFRNYSGSYVPGTLTWDYPQTVVTTTGTYSWTFTPADTVSYTKITGTVTVTVY